ncbi:MAG: succinate-semialdehyde dehydrogenase [Pseudomonadota bacterium]|jgi:succinate-semialdehyde dehydrogenase/glutarate-semialdehyde dehydrogenase
MQLEFKDKLFINGKWIETEKKIVVNNPATNQVIAYVAHAEANQVIQAIDAAETALIKWRKVLAKTKANLIMEWYHLMLKHQNEIARLITLECGKPLKEALAEVIYAASFVQWAAEQAKRIDGVIISGHLDDVENKVHYEPVGIVGAITPWNFPAAMVTRKIAPAIAAGCTIVLKPAELTPLTAYYLADLASKAGIMPGVINLVTGDAPQIGRILGEDARVRKITFTGSTKVGKTLFAGSANSLKRMSLELGGNAPFIVFEDANLEEALAGLIASKMRNCGQTCICPNRIYVHKQVYTKFAAMLKDELAKMKVGNGLDADVVVGPLINQAAKVKVKMHINDAMTKGAQLYFGGSDLAGNFMQPTILINVAPNSQVAYEETFGPLFALFQFESDEEVLSLANASEYGLAAYFYTQNYKRINKMRNDIEAGMIGINSVYLSTDVVPFGGVKSSGFGREGSQLGIYEFLNTKYSLYKY